MKAIGHMPAEWERHEATWLTWPHNPTDWPGKMSLIPWVYAEIVRHLVPHERVHILVNSKEHETKARRILGKVRADMEAVDFFRLPTDRSWIRDNGPIFVRAGKSRSSLAIAHFHFNGWSRYRNWKRDCEVPARLSRILGIPVRDVRYGGRRVVLEGGSIDVNGRGNLVTTKECLLHQQVQARNPHLEREDLEAIFREYLGTRGVIWLGRGVAGDDTHGHVDDICRFTSPKTLVACRAAKKSDENYRPLEENRERLQTARLADGARPQVVDLPMPTPLYSGSQRLPASYANFYIANRTVLVPTFNDPADYEALGILSELFPQRAVIGIHSVDLAWGLGAIHCITQQQPYGA